MRWIVRLGAVALAGQAVAAPPAPLATSPHDPPIEVMVLGTYHFDNPGLDLANAKADDVLKPRRQKELEALAAALAGFHPTRIAVERIARTPALTDHVYAGLKPGDLSAHRDERYQIAYRLAQRLNLPIVYAIDEQPGEGEPDYFPFGNLADWAKANGREEALNAALDLAKGETARIETLQAEGSIAHVLIDQNLPERAARDQGWYYGVLNYGDTERQPGAELNAYWYMRNAKIFAKLMTVAKPGDRILVVYGAGHSYWLRHFAATTPGYRNVDPTPYLKKAE